MIIRVVLEYDTAAKKVRMQRPKSVALTMEALGTAIQGLGAVDVKGLERDDSRITIPDFRTPSGFGG